VTGLDVRELLLEATAELQAAGVGSPRVDAELLLAHVLGVARSALLTAPAVADAAAARFADLIARRVGREPLQYIVGSAPFRHLDLAVGPGVFIPRPETELLVDAALDAIRSRRGPTVVDLCSGSGAIALAIAQERPDAVVIAVEADPEALSWLRRNAAGTRVSVEATDVRDRDSVGYQIHGHADAVVSNPPYVPEGAAVDPEVRADPHRAVFAGSDGLALIPAVIDTAALLLRQPGHDRDRGAFFAIEHDDSHGETVPAMLRADPRWTGVELHHDLTGRPRFTTAFRTATAP
jgi:release factor glutamine methyltransferase